MKSHRITRLSIVLATLCQFYIPTAYGTQYWDVQRKGANWFNRVPTRQWLLDARHAGISMVRLAPDKWKGAQRDFLIGNADKFEAIPNQDLSLLKTVLSWADTIGVRIVLVPLSLPGSRWRQNNGGKFDPRLWQDTSYQSQAARFWKELSSELAGTPSLAGYDILNEPTPESASGFGDHRRDYKSWSQRVEGTPADLNKFYASMVAAIRSNDATIPIIIEAGNYANPSAISYLQPIVDSNVFYSVHMYEPWEYTNFKANAGHVRYSREYILDAVEAGRQCAPFQIIEPLKAVEVWQKEHLVPSNRILIGEFGCHRRNAGVAEYLTDVISIFDEHGWHWAFYSFREDVWDGMDYEMGDRPAGAKYWESIERGDAPVPTRSDNPIWEVIERELREP